MDNQVNGHNKVFKIKTMSELTGFSPTLLRAWERRYDFLKPDRMPGGHRLYSDEDLGVLKRVKSLLDEGHSVGEVAALGRDALAGVRGKTMTDIPAEMMELAPTNLAIHRENRYRGEGLSVSLRSLKVEDLTTVCRLYEVVKRTYELWLYMEGARDESILESQLLELDRGHLQSDVAQLRVGDPVYPLMVKMALKDTRWGALGPLLERVQAFRKNRSSRLLTACVLLARDQAKIMRNAFHDLDAPLREADESDKAHGIKGMVEKFKATQERFHALLDWDGSVSSRCLETSAVDRVLYDFVRRTRLVEPDETLLWVGAVNKRLTRWAFYLNKDGFEPHDAQDLATLAVAKSVGLTPAAALQQGYIGAERGWAWFHWPVYEPPEGSTVCECEL